MNPTSGSPRVLTIGETMGLAVNDRPGPLASSRSHTISFGGAESNVAIALSRLGVPPAWVSRLGDDPFGELIRRELTAEGVAVHADIDPERPTGFMHKHRRTNDTATVTFWRHQSAASAIMPTNIPSELLHQVELVHLTGILPGLSQTARECALATARQAKAAGMLLSFDINHRAKVWRDRNALGSYRELIELADIVFAGDDEASLLVGDGAPKDLAARLQEIGPPECIIKLGADGAHARIANATFERSAHKVAAVDTVGAGDAFVAGYLSAVLDRLPPEKRLGRATAAGAYACTVLGDWEGAPTLAELETLDRREGITR